VHEVTLPSFEMDVTRSPWPSTKGCVAAKACPAGLTVEGEGYRRCPE